jgi:hypothetical protein
VLAVPHKEERRKGKEDNENQKENAELRNVPNWL